MFDALPLVLGIYLLILVGYIVWESAVMVQDKKDSKRSGTTDYYGEPVKKDND